jgi:hypothetical protein
MIDAGRKKRYGIPQGFLAVGAPPPWAMVLFLLAIAIAYSIAYFTAPALPGGSSPGWFAWFDQGKYLTSASAIAAGDFSPARHFYPPLYPILGAIFVKWLPRDPFLPVDFVSLLTAACAFFAAASRFVWWPVAALVFLLTVVADHSIFNQYVYPWTSTPVAAIFSVLVLLLAGKTSDAPPAAEPLVFGSLYGLLVPLRPIDAAAFAPMVLAYCWRLAANPHQRASGKITWNLALFGLGLLPGIAIFLAFNLVVFHAWAGGYLHTSVYNFGFTTERLPEKAVSMFLDSGSIYLVPRAALLAHYPWLILSAIGAMLALLRGPFVLRSIAICLATTAMLYLPYDDFLPTGLWRDSNIHYFTWMFPWLGFFALWPFFVLMRAWRDDPAVARRLALLCAGVFGLAIIASITRFELRAEPARLRVIGPGTVEIDASSAADVIDLVGLRGDANGLYHGAHRLNAGSSVFHAYRDFRVLPERWGARMVFLRSVPTAMLRLQLDPHVTLSAAANRAVAWRIGYAIGFPCWIATCGPGVRSGG